MIFPKKGLYAITQTENKTDDQIKMDVLSAIKGGAVVIQYRNKNAKQSDKTAGEILEICRQNNVPLIINDDIDLARRIGADGVHLGKDDNNIENARQQLGENAIIGISCYNSIERALQAQNQKAGYVAFGRFFPSSSKPLASPADIETLKKARTQIHIPIVAIGGILPENGKQLIDAGADLLAVIGGIFNKDPEQSARAYVKLFNN